MKNIPDNEGTDLVLVVEDEALIRIATVDCLQKAGFKVIEAASAFEALLMLHAREDVKAVLIAIEMPGMDGLPLVVTIHETWPSIALLVTFGRAASDPSALPEGAIFIARPCESDQIVDGVARLIGPS